MPLEQSKTLFLETAEGGESEITCQNCGQHIGYYKPASGASNQKSHGICENCRKEKFVPELDDLKELVKNTMKKAMSVIDDASLEPQEKLVLLQTDKMLIENHSGLDLTEENLPEIKLKLAEKFAI